MANTTGNTTETTNKKDKTGRKKIYAAISLLLVFLCLGCIIWLVSYLVGLDRVEQELDNVRESYVLPAQSSAEDSQPTTTSQAVAEEESQEVSSEIPASPEASQESPLSDFDLPYTAVDIAALKEKENQDIYAWISIPGTAIDYPVLQHPEEMDYYLQYNMDGTKGYPGCIYTQRMNSKDWTDKNTVLYGHNMKNGTMFAGLHQYEDAQFFNENPYIFIYTEDNRILVYQIFAAYEYSDAHLLMMVNTATDESYQSYLSSIFENDGLNNHFNREPELTPQDRIITLSTCISSKPTRRWLVQGVLIEEGEQFAED